MNGIAEIPVRGSISDSVFIVGPGGPGGVKLPCESASRHNGVIVNKKAQIKCRVRRG